MALASPFAVNGIAFRSRLSVYGGKTYLGFTRDIRTAAGIELGDQVSVSLERDTVPRSFEIPDDFAAALAGAPAAQAVFDGLSFSNRKEYVHWITDAKRPETRAKRLAKAAPMLIDGRKTPDHT